MTPEMIAIIGASIALAGIILHSSRDTSRALADIRMEMTDLRKDVAELRERMARLEGLFEGFTGRKRPVAAE